MPSYVITGASRGLGFEFLRQLSENPEAIVIGLVRDKASAEKKVAAEIGRSNIHILHGDVDSYESLKKAAEETAKITGGKLDYIIANAAYLSQKDGLSTLNELGDDPEALEEDLLHQYKTNVVGQVHLFNVFLPLIQRGDAKKVVAITSGHADIELPNRYKVDVAGSYAMSKIALNMAIAKFNAEFSKEGILFFCISPGVVATSNHLDPAGLSQREQQGLQRMMGNFKQYAPHFEGPITPKESVENILDVINRASVLRGWGGAFVSHFGNKQWI
ncbi:hypothetical protein M426DRAFT_13538 [Hypoxylon sp. CI-4A]|nr:hypothetical protein M426DRAFT_13538 [Hypoxylon sp. CI-4A]